jgi:hypothetical protein
VLIKFVCVALKEPGGLRCFENEITPNSVLTEEMDLGLQSPEGTSYGSYLLCKNMDYKRKRTELLQNENISLDSQPPFKREVSILHTGVLQPDVNSYNNNNIAPLM